jgi:hypothetical protein
MNEQVPSIAPARSRLAARRAQALKLAGEGHSNVAIGKLLGVAESTIRNDLASQDCEPRTTRNRRNPASQNCESRTTRNRRNSRGFAVPLDSQLYESASLGGPPLRTEPDSQCESAPSKLAESVTQAISSVLAALPTCGARVLEEFYDRARQLAASARAAGDSAAAGLCDDLCERLMAEAQRRAAPANEGEPS